MEFPARDSVSFFEGAFFSYVSLRRAGVPLCGIHNLRFERSLQKADQILGLEAENTRKADEVIVLLERVIGLARSKSEERVELIELKRDIFNDRSPRFPLSENSSSEITKGLKPSESTTIFRWIEARRWRATLAGNGEQALLEELSTKRARLFSASHRPGFSAALDLASPALRDDLTRYIRCPARFSPGKTTRIERSLIRYYARSAVKLSPFSSFMRSRILRIDQDEGCSEQFTRRPYLRRRVRINRSICGELAHRIAQHPELCQFVPVFASGTAVHNGKRVLVLRHRYNISRATRLRVPVESLVDLEYTDALALVMDRLPPAQMIPFGLLTSALAPILGGHDLASQFLHKLIEIGMIAHKIPLPQDDSCTLNALRRYLEGLSLSDPRLISLAHELEQLQTLEIEFERAIPSRRTELIAMIHNTVQDAHQTIEDVPAPRWTGRVLSEEIIEEPVGRMTLSQRWQPAIHDVRSFLQTYVPLLDLFSSVRTSIREVLMREFGGGPVPFLRFAARYRQVIPKIDDTRSTPSSLRNPLGLKILAELEKIRDEIGSVITLPSDSFQFDLEAAAQENDWKQRLLALGLPGPVGDAVALTCFIQPYISSAHTPGIVLNQMDAGPCRALLRNLAASGNQQLKSQVIADLSKTFRQVWKTAEPCTIYAGFDYNLNACPVITDHIIDYAGDAVHEDRSIPLGSLTIGITTKGGICLSTEGLHIVPVHFGAMSSALQPLIPALLLALGRSESILVRPFDPRNWGPMLTTAPDVVRYPRLVFGLCVVRRRGWLIRKEALPKRMSGEKSFAYFTRIRKWQRKLGLSDQVFVRVRALGERDDQDGTEARSSGLPHKPQYVDFRNYFLVESLDDLFNDVRTAAYFEEALPSHEDWAALGQRRAMEMAVDVCIGADVGRHQPLARRGCGNHTI